MIIIDLLDCIEKQLLFGHLSCLEQLVQPAVIHEFSWFFFIYEGKANQTKYRTAEIDTFFL